jgi:hypothetical protein
MEAKIELRKLTKFLRGLGEPASIPFASPEPLLFSHYFKGGLRPFLNPGAE